MGLQEIPEKTLVEREIVTNPELSKNPVETTVRKVGQMLYSWDLDCDPNIDLQDSSPDVSSKPSLNSTYSEPKQRPLSWISEGGC